MNCATCPREAKVCRVRGGQANYFCPSCAKLWQRDDRRKGDTWLEPGSTTASSE